MEQFHIQNVIPTCSNLGPRWKEADFGLLFPLNPISAKDKNTFSRRNLSFGGTLLCRSPEVGPRARPVCALE